MTVDLPTVMAGAARDLDVGTVAGITRRTRSRGPMEIVDLAEVTPAAGIVGDWRGVRKPGGLGRRQVTLMARDCWEAALFDLRRVVPWQERRVNLLTDGIVLPRVPGTRLRLGLDIVLEVTRECDPCDRMEAVAPGLRAALTAEWRGGVCTRVVDGGPLRVGDSIRIEKA